MQLQVIAVFYGRERQFGVNVSMMIPAVKSYDPDHSLCKVNIEKIDIVLKEDRPLTVMPFRLRQRNEYLPIRIMNKADLSSVYRMPVMKELFCFIKIAVLIVNAKIPLVCSPVSGSINVIPSVSIVFMSHL